MAQYRTPHPYDAHFALPANVMTEPPGRGTMVTAQLPRRTFFEGMKNWTGCGYAIPDYIMAEPPGRGAAGTYQRRRKTIPMRIPESLGAFAPETLKPGFLGDPYKEYGVRVAKQLMGTIHEVPQEFRQVALEALLNELKPGLFARVTELANKYKKDGMAPKKSVREAIAAAISEAKAIEIVEVGKRLVVPEGLLGLGMYEALGWNPVSSIKKGAQKVGGAIKTGAQKVGGAVKTAAQKTGGAVKTAGKAVGKGAAAVGKKAYEWGKKAFDFVHGFNCKIMKSGLSDTAAGVIGGYYAKSPEAGVAGHRAVTGEICGAYPKGEEPPMPGGPGYGGGSAINEFMSSWKFPVALGGLGILAVVVLSKKKGE